MPDSTNVTPAPGPDIMGNILKAAEVGYKTKAEKQEKTEEVVAAIKAGAPVMIDAVQEKVLKSTLSEMTALLMGKLSPLAASVVLKKIENAAEMYRTEILLGAANAEYMNTMALNPAQKVIAIGGGIVQKYTPRTQWEYPAYIVAQETKLKQDKKDAEANKTATPVARTLDPSKDTLFSIKV